MQPIQTSTNGRHASLKGRTVALRFPYDPVMIGRIKDLLPWTERRFKKDEQGPRWEIDIKETNYQLVDRFIKEHFQPFDQAMLMALTECYLGMATEQKHREQAAVASRATDAEIEIPGITGTLRPFQRAGVAYAVAKRRTFIADEQGLGKTVQSIATAQAVNAYPCLCVTRASLTSNWRREWTQWVPERFSTSEPKHFLKQNADVLVLSYGSIPKLLEWLSTVKWKSIIVDESQNIKTGKAARTEALLELCKVTQPGTRLALTGTPVEIKPSELISQLKFLDRLSDFGGWMPFATRYCGAYKRTMGAKSFWVTDGATNTEELHEKLRGICYIRRLKKEVAKEIPEKQRQTIYLPIDNREEYARADSDVVSYIQSQRDAKRLAADIDNPTGEDEKDPSIVADLARVGVLKRLAAEGMLTALDEWLEDFASTGQKLILFAHHREIQAKVFGLAQKYGKAVWTRRVSTDAEDIQDAIDQFQNDAKVWSIVCSLSGDNAGHTLTAADAVGFVEQPWTNSKIDQGEDRAHRIGQRKCVTCYQFVAENTIAEEVIDLLKDRRAIVDAVTDGKPLAKGFNAHIGRALLKKIASK